jgi:RNA polymerase sigma-70 factor (ECF subfamily)
VSEPRDTVATPPTPFVPDHLDAATVTALQAGDVAVFETLVRRHHAAMIRIARGYVISDAEAEEIVQDTWLAVLKGIDRFEGRSALRTWIFAILLNQARTRARRRGREVPSPSLDDVTAPTDRGRFYGDQDAFPGTWAQPPVAWRDHAQERLEAGETLTLIADVLRELPDRQREVIVLRDLQGLSSDEVGELLELTPGNQRVLLHRARSKVRAALERHLEEGTHGVA